MKRKAVGVIVALLFVVGVMQAQAIAPIIGCAGGGTWTPGELNIYVFDVEDGDAQLIVGPTGKTLLIDTGVARETNEDQAPAVAAKIREICGVGVGGVFLDYAMVSHNHGDHMGDSFDNTGAGTGMHRLFHPAGENFGVGKFFVRDMGRCTNRATLAIDWKNVSGGAGLTAQKFVCWTTKINAVPALDQENIAGKVDIIEAPSSDWPTIDLGGGAVAKVVHANGASLTNPPITGDQRNAVPKPFSENEYSIAVKITYGSFSYATAGDSGGYDQVGTNAQTRNNEGHLATKYGDVDVARANHHGHGNSSSIRYMRGNTAESTPVRGLWPEVVPVSCGGAGATPGDSALSSWRTINADIYVTNRPCRGGDHYAGVRPLVGTTLTKTHVWIRTGGSGATYVVTTWDLLEYAYKACTGPSGAAAGNVSGVRINEIYSNVAALYPAEWVELYNPLSNGTVNISGLYVDDVAGSGTPRRIPSGTVLLPGCRYVMDITDSSGGTVGYFKNAGDSVRYLGSNQSTVYDTFRYVDATNADEIFFRLGDGGAIWCGFAPGSSNTKNKVNTNAAAECAEVDPSAAKRAT